ncbi:MAG: ChaN family lipoprotein [Gammaproteobacteria bacterium]|nr:ChaN family lipoprotein [Gammaproteobacteria bacterium]
MQAGSLIKLTLLTLLLSHNLQADEQCIPKEQWLLPGSGKTLTTEDYLPQVYKEDLILLGEHHENASHHQWQLTLLKKLYANNPGIVIGLEMFPRRMQPLLDKWINKTIDKDAFIKASEWDDIWAYDFNHYLPILAFARDNNIPLIAINIDKSLLKMAGKHGWNNIPKQHRNGIGDPAKPTEPYVRQLAISFQGHYEDPLKASKQAFMRFVQQQQLWDRAMAEALASARQDNPGKQIVGIVGSWHIIDGHGVPYQLKSLGVTDTLSLVPWDKHLDCASLNPQFADAIFGTLPNDNISISENQ